MFKKLMLLSAILSLGACETINQASQCDPEKNYIQTNIPAMEEYKALFKAGDIKSFYFEETSPRPCYTDLCVRFQTEKLDFLEKNFYDNERKGVYTVKAITNLKDTRCMEKDPSTLNNLDQLCYIVEKNKNNEIKSRFKLKYDRSNKGQTIISFIDLKNNTDLYKKSYQIYTTGAIGGPGGGTCKASNNSTYKFDILSFPTQN